MRPETSIIIRTRNEEKWIGTCLKKIFEQTYKNFEVVIVDSGSNDKTLEIAGKFPIKILKIPFEKFSYPYALNVGIDSVLAQKYVVILSAHSLPISDTWLENGLNNFKKHGKIMGVYGPLKALPGSTIWDWLYFNLGNYLRKFFLNGNNGESLIYKGGIGVMGFTNAIILKELWDKRKFNEAYGAGGEDGEWASYWFTYGYGAIKDQKFGVFHSHNLSLCGWVDQIKHWHSLSNPKPFNKGNFNFRKSNTFK